MSACWLLLRRLLREETEAAEALAKQEAAAEEERSRLRATVREALGRKVSTPSVLYFLACSTPFFISRSIAHSDIYDKVSPARGQ